ncbi:hypothetical protein ACMGGQ_22705 [Enterobacter sp. BNK-13]|uniref:hypothetical protein n=1 Tax=Enterobacter sp. BNK-13 TaxID=3376150 RepID=UPI003B4377FD
MPNRQDSDWKRINQFGREQKDRIARQKAAAPALISANSGLVKLARQLREDTADNESFTDETVKFSIY